MQLIIISDGPDITFELKAKKFSSGSIGFWAGGKAQIKGAPYQCTFSLVKVGSKPKL